MSKIKKSNQEKELQTVPEAPRVLPRGNPLASFLCVAKACLCSLARGHTPRRAVPSYFSPLNDLSWAQGCLSGSTARWWLRPCRPPTAGTPDELFPMGLKICVTPATETREQGHQAQWPLVPGRAQGSGTRPRGTAPAPASAHCWHRPVEDLGEGEVTSQVALGRRASLPPPRSMGRLVTLVF